MNDIRFRIINTDKRQIMIEREQDFSDGDNPYKLSITAHCEVCRVRPILGYSTEKKRDKAFNDLADDKIIAIIDMAISQLPF